MLLLVMFLILIMLWLFREPRFIPGWGALFREEGNTLYGGSRNREIWEGEREEGEGKRGERRGGREEGEERREGGRGRGGGSV